MILHKCKVPPFPLPGQAASHLAVIARPSWIGFPDRPFFLVQHLRGGQDVIFMVIAQAGIKSEVLSDISEDLRPVPAMISRTVLIPDIWDSKQGFQNERKNAVLVNEFQRIEWQAEILLILEKAVFIDVSKRRIQLEIKIPEIKIQLFLLPLAQLCPVFRRRSFLKLPGNKLPWVGLDYRYDTDHPQIRQFIDEVVDIRIGQILVNDLG